MEHKDKRYLAHAARVKYLIDELVVVRELMEKEGLEYNPSLFSEAIYQAESLIKEFSFRATCNY